MALITVIVLSACTSVPLTTLYKLHKIDPMEADPAQIKVAIRADDRIGIREGGAKIEVKFDAEDGALAVFEDQPVVLCFAEKHLKAKLLIKDIRSFEILDRQTKREISEIHNQNIALVK